MKPDASHIKQIKIVSNTHWDREFRKSFERTRRRLLDMMDVTLDILERDPKFASFTMDGHSIMIDDYLEMRPERRAQIQRLVGEGRLILGPWYTLPETLGIGHEPLLRNLLWGRERTVRYGGRPGTVAYTPASWGQTGQLPQLLQEFGIRYQMMYRGISHHECDAEFLWSAPDGSTVTASRFAIYARYNWYYQVHRAVTRGRTFSKDYIWGEFDEVPFRFSDGLAGEDIAFDLKAPAVRYDKSKLRQVIEEMVAAEGPHFTTPVFLAMNGHDISVAYPLESQIAEDAKEILKGKFDIEHTDLETYWAEVEKHLDRGNIAHLHGERRSHLKTGMWTYLFPASISARTYLKVQDFLSTAALVYQAEPLASLASVLGAEYPRRYLDHGWSYLMSNHTHDANGGVAPDAVCLDLEYRYRKTRDIAEIVTEDAMTHVARNLSPGDLPVDAMQLVVFNPLPFERDVTAMVDVEIPREHNAKAVLLESPADTVRERQHISEEKSSAFVDSMWDVPTILDSNRIRFHARFRKLPALGYRVYRIVPEQHEPRTPETLITGSNTMENEFLRVRVKPNGALHIHDKETNHSCDNLNYLSDQGEVGNAWRHVAPEHDRVYNSLGVSANIAVVESGPLTCAISAEFAFPVPADYADGNSRSTELVALPVKITYRLDKGSRAVKVRIDIDNPAKDHWLRANFPTSMETDVSWADSHYDVLSRPIPVPDSTGWVEKIVATHPMRSFAGLSDGKAGLAIFTKGLFEYEAIDDNERTLALSLLRCCRIKLAVSEEKQTELSDQGVQCPGAQSFEYAIYPHAGDWRDAGLLARAAEYYTPPRIAMTGRGQGDLPNELSFLTLDNPNLHITCLKQAENGNGLILRLFNATPSTQKLSVKFGRHPESAIRCRADETGTDPAELRNGVLEDGIEPKKIRTYRLQFD